MPVDNDLATGDVCCMEPDGTTNNDLNVPMIVQADGDVQEEPNPSGTTKDDLLSPSVVHAARTGEDSEDDKKLVDINLPLDRNKKAALLFVQFTAQVESELKQKVMQKVALTDIEKKAASTLASREAMRRAQELNIPFHE